VCYEEVVSGMRRLVAAGHLNLVETLAEQIATLCLEDRRVRVARVRVEKLDVFADATSVGVEIERVAPPA
jgi:dihydroneopterin aldolase